jgi:Cu2+-containing amine oxidase
MAPPEADHAPRLLAEMVVPYGDPTGSNYRRNAFDIGEFGTPVPTH